MEAHRDKLDRAPNPGAGEEGGVTVCDWQIKEGYRPWSRARGGITDLEAIKIMIPGRVVAKQRPRMAVKGRQAYMYTPEETIEYQRRVALFAGLAMQGRELLRCPLAVKIKLFFAHGAGKLPDVDNCIKSILDGLTGVVYVDDRYIAKIYAERCVDAEERAEIEIVPETALKGA